MKLKYLTRPFEVKEVTDDGAISGYGSVFDVADAYHDIVMPGAFTKSLDQKREKGDIIPMLWQHNPADPVGAWTDFKEDDRGLHLSGSLVAGVQRAEEARLLAKANVVRGLSIGYSVPNGGQEWDESAKVNKLHEIKLFEVSMVTFPANLESQIIEVRATLQEGIFPGVRAFEDWLMRDAGFSKEDAIHIVRYGYKSLLMRDADAEKLSELLTNLRRLVK